MIDSIEKMTPRAEDLGKKNNHRSLKDRVNIISRIGATSAAMVAGGMIGGARAAASNSEVHNGRILHSRTRITPRVILDDIYHVAVPYGHYKQSNRFWVLPTTAFLQSSVVGYHTDCGEGQYAKLGNSESQWYYTITPSGTKQKVCTPGINGGELLKSHKNEYQEQLNILGQEVRESSGVHNSYKTISISGNRTETFLEYECPTGSVAKVRGAEIPSTDFPHKITLRASGKEVMAKFAVSTVAMCKS